MDPRFTSLSVGGFHACAVKTDGAPYCWGTAGPDGGTSPPNGLSLESISAGGRHSCGLKPSGSLVCWGGDRYEGVSAGGAVPADLAFTKFTSLSAGTSANCGVMTDNSVTCWGHDGKGRPFPSPEPGGQYVRISVGPTHACGITTQGRLNCWGDIDDRHTADDVPTAAADALFADVSAGNWTTCAVSTEGTVLCWGVLPGGGYEEGAVPHPGSFTSVSNRDYMACGLKSDDALACWDVDLKEAPVPDGTFTAVEVSSYRKSHLEGSISVCALKTDGAVVCWGEGTVGPAPGGAFKSVDIGVRDSICGHRIDNTMLCWNNHGYLPTRTDSIPPPPPNATFISVSTGNSHVCGVTPDGAVQCWGEPDKNKADVPGRVLRVSQRGLRIRLRPENRRLAGLLGRLWPGQDPDRRDVATR